ncbi:MAG: thiamine phosphate synthase [Polyangiaceae bacterium]|nr:thiamine phosphate synthase [Polyangiaceae bacterium]MCE7891104.1 thiamine phosphate synthase [Sorangiineae bacterium PRO1]MCL4754476.1 thiamine phosphate synthase [Myxococcales bacterium]
MIAPRLIVITDFSRGDRGARLARIERCLALARPTSVLVQLRDPELGARARLELGRHLVALARAHGQSFAVNDRLDLAKLLGADAVHLGEASVDVADARRFLPGVWISRAWHSTDRAPEGADALLLSPIFEARHGRPALGAPSLRIARARIGALPLYALGGVTPERASTAMATSAQGVAVIGAVLDDDDPLPLLAALGIRR